MEENKENKEIEVLNLGTLYDLNKNLVQKQEIKLSEGVINSKKLIIKDFLRKTKNHYYMLLSNERKDYTIFTINDNNLEWELEDYEKKKYDKLIDILVDECLFNRGEIRGIDLTKSKDAIEIWLSIEEESYVYYFFPYDAAIIEI